MKHLGVCIIIHMILPRCFCILSAKPYHYLRILKYVALARGTHVYCRPAPVSLIWKALSLLVIYKVMWLNVVTTEDDLTSFYNRCTQACIGCCTYNGLSE